jgi:hypothetical protein
VESVGILVGKGKWVPIVKSAQKRRKIRSDRKNMKITCSSIFSAVIF